MAIQKTCLHCGKDFMAKPKEAATRKFCSGPCYHAHETTKGSRAVERQEFTCKTCGKPFQRAPGELRSYVKQFGRPPLYCSIPCSAVGRRADAEAKLVMNCIHCGKTIENKRTAAGFLRGRALCSTECRSEHRKKIAAQRFLDGKGGRHRKRGGYIWMYIPANLSSTGKKREMLEHRYVMEQHIGRELRPEETVHHKNGVRDDNRIENLELFSSRHGPGQRVIDKVAFAIEILRLYPEFGRAQGWEIHSVNAGGH